MTPSCNIEVQQFPEHKNSKKKFSIIYEFSGKIEEQDLKGGDTHTHVQAQNVQTRHQIIITHSTQTICRIKIEQ